MYTTNLNTLALSEAWYENDPYMSIKVDFPFSQATGTTSSALACFEIEPKHYLATHTDSPEEIVFILSGTVEVYIGDERRTLAAGEAVLIPALLPHAMRNVGAETARYLSFFASATLVSTFGQTLMPLGRRAMTIPLSTADALSLVMKHK